MKIVLLCNTKKSDDKREAEFDSIHTIHAIKAALEAGNNEVALIEADEKALDKLKKEKTRGLDIVFNISECTEGEARESIMPCILDLLKIPYTGSGPLTLAICLDKVRTKEILSHHKIANAPFFVVKTEIEAKSSANSAASKNISFPMIVKPSREGSSKGIAESSVVRTPEQLVRQCLKVINEFSQSALVEKFMSGREFTVSIIGNKDIEKGNAENTRNTENTPVALPIAEILLDVLPQGAERIDGYESKWIYDIPDKPIDILKCPAELNPELERKIKEISLKTFNALDCKDWCRIDIRLDENNEPNVLELNPLPGICPDPNAHSRFTVSAQKAGLSYNEMVLKVLNSALVRHKIKTL